MWKKVQIPKNGGRQAGRKQKTEAISFGFLPAGATRVELVSTVLETAALPLNYAPSEHSDIVHDLKDFVK